MSGRVANPSGLPQGIPRGAVPDAGDVVEAPAETRAIAQDCG